ncbi:hypothetical protein [Oryzomonas sagensis]|uniref:hypothetical protein n=1 Tax=Oryzomonas sagensis TaxID=2603857 RepID=UPI0017829905|nr:hypothetical protein [Oryzomonas sagensis]
MEPLPAGVKVARDEPGNGDVQVADAVGGRQGKGDQCGQEGGFVPPALAGG